MSVDTGARSDLMTVGELARRTGLSHKAIRELEDRGLIYSAGRSEAGYRLFDDIALWCVGAIGELRSLGLTIAEIEELHAGYLADSAHPIGSRLAALLSRSEDRITARIEEQRRTLERIAAYRAANHDFLAGDGAPAIDSPLRAR
jgi:MerR family transcriptional regulator, copper efflux regulator